MNLAYLSLESAVLDARVLGPMPLGDLLLRLGEAEFFSPRWSHDILAELRRFLLARGKTIRQIDHRIAAMTRAFEDACVADYEDLISTLHLPDPDDRHVLAAAIRSRADSLVTENRKHFPAKAVNPYGITVQSLDQFFVSQFYSNPDLFTKILRGQAKERSVNASQLLAKLNAPTLDSLMQPLIES